MGNRTSAEHRRRAELKARSDAIDRQLEEDLKRLRREYKILLLGSGESGASTIVKQMKILYQSGLTDDEIMAHRPIVYRNTLDSAQTIVLAMRKMGFDYVDIGNRLNADRILDYRIDPAPTFVFSSEIAQAIDQLWQDPIISKLMDRSSEFYLMDSAVYFFSNVRRIGSPTYLPTWEDILQADTKSTGITETRLTMGQFQIHILDVSGQRSERKKWIHCFEGIPSIMFCAALSEYDQVLLEEKNQARAIHSRMQESLILFEAVVNSRWFLRTSIFLLLTKIEVFKAKLLKVPLERYFPEYSGGADIHKAAKYILWRFMQTNRARLSVYPHMVQVTDTTNVRLVFGAIKETIIQNGMRMPGVL